MARAPTARPAHGPGAWRAHGPGAWRAHGPGAWRAHRSRMVGARPRLVIHHAECHFALWSGLCWPIPNAPAATMVPASAGGDAAVICWLSRGGIVRWGRKPVSVWRGGPAVGRGPQRTSRISQRGPLRDTKMICPSGARLRRGAGSGSGGAPARVGRRPGSGGAPPGRQVSSPASRSPASTIW